MALENRHHEGGLCSTDAVGDCFPTAVALGLGGAEGSDLSPSEDAFKFGDDDAVLGSVWGSTKLLGLLDLSVHGSSTALGALKSTLYNAMRASHAPSRGDPDPSRLVEFFQLPASEVVVDRDGTHSCPLLAWKLRILTCIDTFAVVAKASKIVLLDLGGITDPAQQGRIIKDCMLASLVDGMAEDLEADLTKGSKKPLKDGPFLPQAVTDQLENHVITGVVDLCEV